MVMHRSGGRRRSQPDVGNNRRRTGEGKKVTGVGKAGSGADGDSRDLVRHVRGAGAARTSSGSTSPKKPAARIHHRAVRPAGGRGKAAGRLPARDSLGRFKSRKAGRAGTSAARKPSPVSKPGKAGRVSKRKSSGKISKKPTRKISKRPAKKISKKPAKRISKKPAKKISKKPAKKISKKPAKKISKRQARKVPRKPARPAKPARKRRRRRPRKPMPPLPAGAQAAQTLMLSKLEEAMGLVAMMFPSTSMAIKSAINSDWTVDGELRVDSLPDELRTMDGMLEIISLLSEAFRAFRPFPQVPDMGGKFWVSFGVRFGPNNETEIGKLEELYKKFRGLFQTGTYPAFAWSLASIQSSIAPGLKTIFEGVARRMGIPPSTLLIRFVWTPGPRQAWRDVPRMQQIKQRPGHWEGEGGEAKKKKSTKSRKRGGK